jgi:hypothetical protein
MLVNPYSDNLPVIPGTRMLITDLGLLGVEVLDPRNARRRWTVSGVYAPAERHLGGIRIKLVDQKLFTTFCNQRDFEVLIELAKPGDWCKWMGKPYVGPKDEGWFGFCMDKIDLEDDLYERELALRDGRPGMLPQGIDTSRRVHVEAGRDAEDMWCLLWDRAPETGMGPDPRLETIYSRWACVSRDWLDWYRT